MNLQPSTNQKAFIITIGMILLIGMLWGATQIVDGQQSSRLRACERAQQYHTSRVSSNGAVIDDTLCGS